MIGVEKYKILWYNEYSIGIFCLTLLNSGMKALNNMIEQNNRRYILHLKRTMQASVLKSRFWTRLVCCVDISPPLNTGMWSCGLFSCVMCQTHLKNVIVNLWQRVTALRKILTLTLRKISSLLLNVWIGIQCGHLENSEK